MATALVNHEDAFMSVPTTPSLQALYQELDAMPFKIAPADLSREYRRCLNLLVLGANTLAFPDALMALFDCHQANSNLDWRVLNLKLVKKPQAQDDKRASALFSVFLKTTRMAYVEYFNEEPQGWAIHVPDLCTTYSNQISR